VRVWLFFLLVLLMYSLNLIKGSLHNIKRERALCKQQ
jgi:hypothetical protein